MNTKIYQLYHDKEHGILRVSPMQKVFYDTNIDHQLAPFHEDYILYYNHCHLFSCSRKALVELARNMKTEWIQELEVKLEMYKNIKI